MLGERIRQSRIASGLSLRGLADQVGLVTAAAISKYELGKDIPRQSVLLAIAKALNIPVERLFTPPGISLTSVEFRKSARLPENKSLQIQAKLKDELEDYIDLSELLVHHGLQQFNNSVALTDKVADLAQLEEYAIRLREQWGLGVEPIRNVTEAIETTGIKIIILDADERFDELTCLANNTYPIVVIRRLPETKGDIQRFNVLHGLGHLLLSPTECIDKESMCNYFAECMLAPGPAVFKRLGHKRKTLDLDFELPMLKQEFGMGINTWINRSFNLGIIDDTTRRKLLSEVIRRGWKTNEPVSIPFEEPIRFQFMVSQAQAEGIITQVKAAAYMKKPHGKVKPAITGIPDSAIKDYESGGALDSWEDIKTGVA
jgi:transcriptional regulator with XRE-family HTH domain